MSENRVERCPCALRWPVNPATDFYCGFCGRRMRALEAVPLPKVQAPWIMGGEFLQVDLEIRNTGLVPLTVTGLEWVSPRPPEPGILAAALPNPLALPPQTESHVSLRVAMIPEAKSRTKIVLQLRLGPADTGPGRVQLNPIEIPLAPPPRVEVSGLQEGRILPVERLEESFTLSLTAADQDIMLAEENQVVLKTRDGKEEVPLDPAVPVSLRLLRSRQPVEFQFSSPAALFPGQTRDRDVFVALRIQGMATPVRTDIFTLRKQIPAEFTLQLELPDGMTPRVLKGYQRSFGLLLLNRSPRIFSLQKITVDLPAYLREQGLLAHVLPARTPPFFVEKVKRIELGTLVLNTERWSGGSTRSEIRITAEVENGPAVHTPLPIHIVVSRPDYNRPLGIDFGNTNTSAAHFDDRNLPLVIPLTPLVHWPSLRNQSINPHVVATLVQYAPAGDSDSDWTAQSVRVADVGEPVRARMKQNPIHGRRVVSFFKPRIGFGEAYRFPLMPDVRNKTFDSVTADYLQRVLLAVEEETGLTHRRLVLTHPVRFWTRQREALRAALFHAIRERKEDPEEWTVSFLDEATAVILYHTIGRYVLGHAVPEEGPAEQETVLVFDFGGGTIDMTLCEVSRDLETGHCLIRHLDFDGTGEFGGERITELIAQRLYERACEAANGLESPRPGESPGAAVALRESGEEIFGGKKKSGKSSAPAKFHHAVNTKSGAVVIPYGRWDVYPTVWDQHTKTAIDNYVKLYYGAEDLKIDSLDPSENEAGDPAVFDQIDRQFEVTTVPANDNHAPPVRFSFPYRFKNDRDGLKQAVLTGLEGALEMVRKMIGRFRERARLEGNPLPRLSRVLMSGQSSRLPFIQEALRQAVQEANEGEPVEVELLNPLKEAVALGAAIYGALDDLAQVEMNRCGRVHIFLQKPGGAIGAGAFVPVFRRLSPLPATVICSSINQEGAIHYPLYYGMRIRVIESFVDLSDRRELNQAVLDQDYRVLAEIPVTPPGWNHGDIRGAALKITFSEDEQITVTLVPGASTASRVESVRIWPRPASEPRGRAE
ncbi:MAG: hypothetical protein ACE15F_00540 [bacterium]